MTESDNPPDPNDDRPAAGRGLTRRTFLRRSAAGALVAAGTAGAAGGGVALLG